MLAITAKPLSNEARVQLNSHSATIEGIEGFPEQIAKAKGLWEAKTPASLFRELRVTLGNMCNGVRRCMYCEDSQADEIEHRRPKKACILTKHSPGIICSMPAGYVTVQRTTISPC